MENIAIELKIIGIIHSPYKSTDEAPFSGNGTKMQIEIFHEYEKGLTDLEGFTYIHVFYWLHHSIGFSNMVVTPWESNPHGVFSTRSPYRPNPLGYSIATLIARCENYLTVSELDAIDGTPVIDIKPYIGFRDAKIGGCNGWLDRIKS